MRRLREHVDVGDPEIELAGLWSLPGSPTAKVPGTLIPRRSSEGDANDSRPVADTDHWPPARGTGHDVARAIRNPAARPAGVGFCS